MKNPNSPINKIKKQLKERWSDPDHPGAEPRFQVILFAKDIAIFILLPALAVFMFKSCENAASNDSRPKLKKLRKQNLEAINTVRSQIIDFTGKAKPYSKFNGIPKRAPGTLIKVRLLNKVETYSNAPVHAVIVDKSLGYKLRGATLIGDATPDPTYERINITFNLLKHPSKRAVAIPIAARALSLSGTLGVAAKKKEGYFARAALGSAQNALSKSQNAGGDSKTLKDVLLSAFASGLLNESGSATTVEQNRANVLTLIPSAVFYVELTDYFPEGRK